MCAAVYRLRHLVKATKVNAGLAESNGRLLLGIWRDSLHVTCKLTACTLGSAPGPTLGNEYGKTLPLPFWYRLTQVVVEKSALSGWDVVVMPITITACDRTAVSMSVSVSHFV